ncbi:Glutathione-binding protein GsiB [Micromonospora noduli]|uniref:Glutathione-binding protein GsiB n=1 Tax=Micromonospora noduli TaxID=709876 RepID=A0A328N0Q5_9ACTN|nr:ABC transporter substrate-binding protein [Micromonospora noduli]KAB1928624.1 ABC transporter substrate-binding protein [Micromonospora noduli]RAN93199.1 Glutathione-binding protein GsiB [Micromonospora noduli]RAO19402.1 Glutathione-binding protein GsiB [Micromonospora noduli]RAO31446.1 Glutathione-binding protein GsiB [Micromonospora noduli]RAO33234.1 Glutathione-binding protein GsiB [Micromonospora noduli]
MTNLSVRETSLPRRRLLRVAVAAAAVVCTVVACSPVSNNEGGDPSGGDQSAGQDSFGTPADPAAVKQGGKLVIALSAEPDALDPTLSRSLYSRYVFQAMCQKLYDVNEQAQVVPQLATALPTTSGDGRTVTIPLRPGVRFADGTAFDSAAVKATLQRHLTNARSARKSELGPIDGVDTPDAQTVVLRLKQPFAPLLGALADRAGMIMSAQALRTLGDDFASAPVCVGPFKFAKRVPQNSIEVVRDPNYYDASKVHLDAISWRILTDASIRAANLRSGDAQVADSVSTQDVASLRQDTAVSVLQSQSLGYQGLTINVGNVDGVGTAPKPINRPLAQNAKVRQAFEHAIDRKALVDAVFNGLHAAACSPISPASTFSSPEAQTCPAHDPAKAKQLLAEAGVQTPYTVTMLASNTPDTLRLAQALQSMVKDGGFDLKINPVEYSSLLDEQDRGNFELLQLGWSGRIDPDANITNFVGTGASQNVAGYSNPQLDTVLTQARQAGDVEERRKLYGQAVTLLQQDDALIYLYRQRNLTAVSKQIQGLQVYPDGVIRAAFAGFGK